MSNNSKIKKKSSPLLIAIGVILALYSLSIVCILIWGFYNSFKDSLGFEYADNPVGLPTVWHFENIQVAMDAMKVEIDVFNSIYATRFVTAAEMYYNTILYAGGSAFLHTLMPCLVAYVVSKFGKKFKYLNIYTTVVLVCMSISIVGSEASSLQMARRLGMTDQIWGLWILKCHFLGMYYLVFLGAFNVLPDSYAESAKIDGASNFTVMLKIMLPLVKTSFATVFLLHFITYWNDYQTPLLYMPNRPTISYGLYRFSNSVNAELSTVPMQLMGSMVVFIPILLVFIIFQKRLMGNISMGGLKE